MLRRLQAAFHRMTEFTADASHELRTPVSVIQTTAELMQTKPRTIEEHLAAWSRVHAETERTGLLISDLLLLARSDAGKNDLELSPVDLTEIAHTAAEEMRVIAEAKGLTLAIETPKTCPTMGDADALRRAICILLDNAIKFTSAPGDVRVSIVSGESPSRKSNAFSRRSSSASKLHGDEGRLLPGGRRRRHRGVIGICASTASSSVTAGRR